MKDKAHFGVGGLLSAISPKVEPIHQFKMVKLEKVEPTFPAEDIMYGRGNKSQVACSATFH